MPSLDRAGASFFLPPLILTSSRLIAVAAERLIRFIDDSGRSISTLLEERPARLRVFDAGAAGQPQVQVEVASQFGLDRADRAG